ncbi:hypothetical protein ScPMuIL_013776 [Solemya velum]
MLNDYTRNDFYDPNCIGGRCLPELPRKSTAAQGTRGVSPTRTKEKISREGCRRCQSEGGEQEQLRWVQERLSALRSGMSSKDHTWISDPNRPSA